MATTKSKRFGWTGLVTAVLLILGMATGYFVWDGSEQGGQGSGQGMDSSSVGNSLEVRFLDVGQADSTLILLPGGKTMLIDAGGNSTADALTEYLEQQGITRIDYLLGTHPHEDHIGGLDRVIDRLDVGALYMPRVDDSQVPTTRTYEDVLTSVEKRGLTIQTGRAGVEIARESGWSAEILAPNSSRYEGLNSYSIAVRLQYGTTSFLFMGDAEQDSEQEMIDRYSLQADVLKCGHHGSSTSSSKALIQAVDPKYAVISCGKDNSYGHPHRETLNNLSKNQAEVFRTDQQGTVTVISDGSKLRVSAGGPSIR